MTKDYRVDLHVLAAVARVVELAVAPTQAELVLAVLEDAEGDLPVAYLGSRASPHIELGSYQGQHHFACSSAFHIAVLVLVLPALPVDVDEEYAAAAAVEAGPFVGDYERLKQV